MIIIYLLPAFILSLRNRESGYERGWVEMLYLTYQTSWSIGKSFPSFIEVSNQRYSLLGMGRPGERARDLRFDKKIYLPTILLPDERRL
jgi:hypothetical protein